MARLAQSSIDDTEDVMRSAIEAALPVVRERAELLRDVSDALEADDTHRAVSLMRRYCGLPPVRIEK